MAFFDPQHGGNTALEKTIREEFNKKSFANVFALLQQDDVAVETRETIMLCAVRDDDALHITKEIVEKSNLKTDDIQLMIMGNMAAKAGQVLTVQYFIEQSIAKGVPPSDAYARAFEHIDNASQLARLVDALKNNASDAQRALDQMLVAAAREKSAIGMRHLLTLGADPNIEDGIVLEKLVFDYPKALYDDQPIYMDLVSSIFSAGFKNQAKLDQVFDQAVDKFCDGTQHLSTIVTLLVMGKADPYRNMSQSLHKLCAAALAQGKPELEGTFKNLFENVSNREKKDANTELFAWGGESSPIHRLCEIVNNNDDTGWMLEARAQTIGGALQIAACMDGKPLPTLDDIVSKNKHGQSLLTLCVDRGLAGELLRPQYWQGQEMAVSAALVANLTKEQLADKTLSGFSASLQQYTLHKKMQGGRFRL